MTLSHSLPCNHPSFRYPTDLLYPLPDARTSLIRKHMYSYISENNSGPSNQIIVPIGYNLFLNLALDSRAVNFTLQPFTPGKWP